MSASPRSPVILVGTAAWNVPAEHAGAFPASGSHLERYAARFDLVEINSTFYRRHQPKTFERWARTTPPAFRFAVKMPKSITHEHALVGADDLLRAFFDDIAGLGEKLGPVLVQLPGKQRFDAKIADAFFRALRSLHDGPVVIEPRHAGWYADDAERTFVRYRVSRVVADPPRPADAPVLPGANEVLYLRLHGTPRVYSSAYGPARVAAIADTLRAAQTPAFCVFDNTAAGAAAGDALTLRAALEG